MRKIAYFGYSAIMLGTLVKSDDFDLIYVVGVKKRLSKEYLDLVEKGGFTFIEIENKKELLDHTEIFNTCELILMYKFEFIIPEEIVKSNRIINFHGGSLFYNRGAHAVVWSVLLRERQTCFSCYELTGGIDEGLLIARYDVIIDRDDNVADVNLKLVKGIPYLLAELREYLLSHRTATLVKDGKYRRKICTEDFTVKIDEDTPDIIRGKILSQAAYSGALLYFDGLEHRVRRYENIEIYCYQERRKIEQRWNQISITDGNDGIRIYLED